MSASANPGQAVSGMRLFYLAGLACLSLVCSSVPRESRAQDAGEIVPRWFRKLDLFAVELLKDSPLARDVGFPYKQGYFVAGVAADSPAHRAGVRRGDIIVSMDFKLEEAGKRGLIKVFRGAQIKDLPFTVPKDPFPFPPELAADFEPRATPATLVVDQQGKAAYRTITAALSIAAPGDTVEVRDGLYRESLIVPRGVTLRGVGPGSACVESPMPLILFGARNAVIENLACRGANFAVEVCHGSRITLRGCVLSATAGDALIADRVDGLAVKNCSVTSSEIGVRLERSKGSVVDCVVTKCRFGIALQRQAELEAIGNTLDRNLTGILVNGAQATAIKNVITGQSASTGTGVMVDGSRIALHDNTVQRFRLGFESREVQGELRGNRFMQNGYGIRHRAGRLNLESNTFLMNATAAIVLSRHTYSSEKPLPDAPLNARIAFNTISANSLQGIVVADRADAEISHNLIEGNGYGIEVKEATARIVNNTIVLQRFRAVELAAKSRSEVHNNIIAFNRWGMVVDVEAQRQNSFNNVFGNAANLSFPLASGDYVRGDRLPLADGKKLLAHIYPADDLKAASDVSIDPQFVRLGDDYRLAASSPLAQVKGIDGLRLGAFEAAAASGVAAHAGAAGAAPSPAPPRTPLPEPGTAPRAASGPRRDWRELVEFRDVLRPDSEESLKSEYRPVAWSPRDRELVYQRFAAIAGTAPGLMEQAAMDGPISLYRIDLPTASQAKAAYRRLALNQSAFPNPQNDWLTRIIAHELAHAADPYGRMSTEAGWRTLVEPRIAAARELLKQRGLTTLAAAQMPIGPQRSQLETALRRESGLPSAYAAQSIEEATAEIVSFMVDGEADYAPPPAIAAFLRQRLTEPGDRREGERRGGQEDGQGDSRPAAAAYREGLRLSALKDYPAAIEAYSEALRLSPDFAFALMERGIARSKLNAYAEAAADYSRALMLVSPYSRHAAFLQAEKQHCEKQALPLDKPEKPNG